MTTEERVMSLFESANPVPEPGDFIPQTASDYLATLDRKTNAMTLTAIETETPSTTTRNDPGSLPPHRSPRWRSSADSSPREFAPTTTSRPPTSRRNRSQPSPTPTSTRNRSTSPNQRCRPNRSTTWERLRSVKP